MVWGVSTVVIDSVCSTVVLRNFFELLTVSILVVLWSWLEGARRGRGYARPSQLLTYVGDAQQGKNTWSGVQHNIYRMLSGETWSWLRLLGLNKFDPKMARWNANVLKLQSSCAAERIISGEDNGVGPLRNQMVDLDLGHSRQGSLLRLLETDGSLQGWMEILMDKGVAFISL